MYANHAILLSDTLRVELVRLMLDSLVCPEMSPEDVREYAKDLQHAISRVAHLIAFLRFDPLVAAPDLIVDDA